MDYKEKKRREEAYFHSGDKINPILHPIEYIKKGQESAKKNKIPTMKRAFFNGLIDAYGSPQRAFSALGKKAIENAVQYEKNSDELRNAIFSGDQNKLKNAILNSNPITKAASTFVNMTPEERKALVNKIAVRAGRGVVAALKDTGTEYSNLFKHPIKSFRLHPFASAINTSVIFDLAGGIVGNLSRGIVKAGTKEGAKEIIKKAALKVKPFAENVPLKVPLFDVKGHALPVGTTPVELSENPILRNLVQKPLLKQYDGLLGKIGERFRMFKNATPATLADKEYMAIQANHLLHRNDITNLIHETAKGLSKEELDAFISYIEGRYDINRLSKPASGAFWKAVKTAEAADRLNRKTKDIYGRIILPKYIASARAELPLKEIQRLYKNGDMETINKYFHGTPEQLKEIVNLDLKETERAKIFKNIDKMLKKNNIEGFQKQLEKLQKTNIKIPRSEALSGFIEKPIYVPHFFETDKQVLKLFSETENGLKSMRAKGIISREEYNQTINKLASLKENPEELSNFLTNPENYLKIKTGKIKGAKYSDFFAKLNNFIPNSLKFKAKGTFGYIENNPEAIFSRHYAKMLSMRNSEKVVKALEKLSIPYEDVGVAIGKEIPEGYVKWNPGKLPGTMAELDDLESRIIKSGETGAIDENLLSYFFNEAKNMEIGSNGIIEAGDRLLPLEVFEKIKSNASPLFSKGVTNALRVFYDAPTNAWRKFVLAARPQWVVNNKLGNEIFMLLAGVTPKTRWQALQKEFKRQIPLEVRGTGFGEEFTSISGKLGSAVEDHPFAAKMIQKIGDVHDKTLLKKWEDIVAGSNAIMEGSDRGAVFIQGAKNITKKDLLKIGEDGKKMLKSMSDLDKVKYVKGNEKLLNEAIDYTNEFMNDYFKQGKFQRQILRRAFPFVSFTKHYLTLAAKIPLKYPKRAFIMKQFGQLLSVLDEEYKDQTAFKRALDFWGLPDFANVPGAVKIGGITNAGNQIYLNPQYGNPFGGVVAMGLQANRNEPITALAESAGLGLSGLNPYLKAGLERLLGRDLFTGAKYEKSKYAGGYQGHGLKNLRVAPTNQSPSYLELVAREFPPYRILHQMTTSGLLEYSGDPWLGNIIRKFSNRNQITKPSRAAMKKKIFAEPNLDNAFVGIRYLLGMPIYSYNQFLVNERRANKFHGGAKKHIAEEIWNKEPSSLIMGQ